MAMLTALLAAYAEQVAENDIAFEVRRAHRLAGLLAIERGDFERALSELEQAGQRDPWIVYHTARVYAGLQDPVLSREGFEEAAEFNELNASFVWVRPLARHRLASM